MYGKMSPMQCPRFLTAVIAYLCSSCKRGAQELGKVSSPPPPKKNTLVRTTNVIIVPIGPGYIWWWWQWVIVFTVQAACGGWDCALINRAGFLLCLDKRTQHESMWESMTQHLGWEG